MILVCPDKFKGTYSAMQICRMVERRLRQDGITEPICLRPLSDGGEGIADVFMPGGMKIAPGVYEHDGKRLVVSSEIVGLKAFEGLNIPLMRRSSIAMGRAIEQNIPTTIAIGGTATSDGGAGFLQGLGAVFFDTAGNVIREPICPASLPLIVSADLSALRHYSLQGIIDVKASLYEGTLSALDFAKQKALPGESLHGLKAALRNFQTVLGGSSEWDGAGGGLGYALASVCKAPCISGAQAAVDALDIDWIEVSLVITGEGRVDRQTVRGGKLVDAVYRAASRRNIPCLVLYGQREDGDLYPMMEQIDTFMNHDC